MLRDFPYSCHLLTVSLGNPVSPLATAAFLVLPVSFGFLVDIPARHLPASALATAQETPADPLMLSPCLPNPHH